MGSGSSTLWSAALGKFLIFRVQNFHLLGKPTSVLSSRVRDSVLSGDSQFIVSAAEQRGRAPAARVAYHSV